MMKNDELKAGMNALSLLEYRALVKKAAKKMDGQAIYNASAHHAQIVIETLFETAQVHVWLLSGELHGPVYGCDETIEAAEQFLEREGHICALLENEPEPVVDADGTLIGPNVFYSHFRGRSGVEFRRLPETLRNHEFHFTIADSKSFRFEPDKKQKSAVAAFGDVVTAQHLEKAIFLPLWDVSESMQ